MSFVNSNGYIQPIMGEPKNAQIGADYTLAFGGGNLTLTLPQVMNGYIHIPVGQGVHNLTTPTAAQLISAMGAKAGSYIDLVISTLNNDVTTLVGGTDVTLVGTAAIATLQCATVRFIVLTATTVRAVIFLSA